MGGISTSIKSNEAKNTVAMKFGEKDQELIVTRHSQFSKPINILNLYGEQESRVPRNDIEDNWNNILIELEKIERAEEEI